MNLSLFVRTGLFIALFTTQITALSRAPEAPLKDRVAAAEKIFVGKVINKEADGDWVRADLLVEKPLRNATAKKTVPVIWRRKLGEQHLYDVTIGSKGVALLKDQHEKRFWLRSDKFEKLDKLEEIEALIENEKVED